MKKDIECKINLLDLELKLFLLTINQKYELNSCNSLVCVCLLVVTQ